MDQGLSPFLRSITVPPFLFYPLIFLLLCVSAIAFALPFLLTPSDTFSRRSILLLSILLCCQAGVLLSSSFFSALTASLTLSSSLGRTSFLPLLFFLFGLLSPATFERTLLLLGGYYVKRRRAREAELEEEAAALNHNISAHQPLSQPESHDDKGHPSAPPARSHRGRREAPNPLLPPPVKDYRHKRHSLDELSSEEEFDFDDADQLSPPLFSSSSSSSSALLAHPSTSYYTYALPHVDAQSFIAEQRYIARCVFCKENVATRKAAAYHSAGCPLKHIAAFTVASHSLASLRGRRQMTLDDGRIPPPILTLISLATSLVLSAAVGATAAVALQSTALLDLVSDVVTLSSLLFFLSFTTALTVRQQRAGMGVNVAVGVAVTLTTPSVALMLSAVPLVVESSVCQIALYAWLGGVMCWVSVIDVIVEEMERRDAKEGKWPAFIASFLLMTAINVG